MGDTTSEEYRRMRDERRELVQLAVEECVKDTGQVPTPVWVADQIGSNRKTVERDWDALARQGVVPSRVRAMPCREPARNLGTEGGGALLTAEGMLRAVVSEITKATPEYLAMSREFWLAHLEIVSRLTEEAIALAMGTTVDDFIGQIRKEER